MTKTSWCECVPEKTILTFSAIIDCFPHVQTQQSHVSRLCAVVTCCVFSSLSLTQDAYEQKAFFSLLSAGRIEFAAL